MPGRAGVGGSAPVAERLECVACATAIPAELREVAARGFMIVVQDFQDPYTLDVEKLRKCCVSEIVPDGRLIPFCAYNSVGYREQMRAAAGGPGVAAGLVHRDNRAVATAREATEEGSDQPPGEHLQKCTRPGHTRERTGEDDARRSEASAV